jgi:hypothetical protein
MRVILFFLCCALSVPASAQWYRLDLKLIKHERFPLIEQVTKRSIRHFPVITITKPTVVYPVKFGRSEYSYEAAEKVVMKDAQHNMRFREYNDASYNFSELAKLYILQNRYSEAMWYLLQSNQISRQQDDEKHTIDNLVDLATVKSGMGEYVLAQQDLTEAHDIAFYKGFTADIPRIEKKIAFLKQNSLLPARTDLRYAETPDVLIKE